MKIKLNNIAKINKAEVVINGITVIAGENDTGKSTIGKALFSVFNGFYHKDETIKQESIEAIKECLNTYIRVLGDSKNIYSEYVDELAGGIYNRTMDIADAIKNIQDRVVLITQKKNTKSEIEYWYDDTFNRLENVLSISNDEILTRHIEKSIQNEFFDCISNVHSKRNGEIFLEIKNKKVGVKIANNMVKSITESMDLNTEVLYIDNPFVLDELSYLQRFRKGKYYNHKEHLQNKLLDYENSDTIVNEILTDNKLKEINDILNHICTGNVTRGKMGKLAYEITNAKQNIDIHEISSGLKTFTILKMLLQSGVIEDNGTIILDEPEIHLHPEWQIIFAELIVLLNIKFNLNVLLNSHSPYFIEAIETYVHKYNIEDKVKYYLTEKDGVQSNVVDVSDNVERIYKKLALPFQKLIEERNNDETFE